MTVDSAARVPGDGGATQVTAEVRQLPDGVARVDVAGEVDLGSAAALTDALRRATDRRPGRLEVDLSEVTFMGCAGIAALVAAQRAVPVLTVVDAPGPVRRLLLLAGLGECLATPDS